MTRKQAIVLAIILFVLFLGVPYFGPHSWGNYSYFPSGFMLALVLVLLLAP
jgi:hypothetical protein